MSRGLYVVLWSLGDIVRILVEKHGNKAWDSAVVLDDGYIRGLDTVSDLEQICVRKCEETSCDRIDGCLAGKGHLSGRNHGLYRETGLRRK